jgi:hypothetical protein
MNVISSSALLLAADLAVSSIESSAPPHPDISCSVAGVPHYFELTRMVHPRSANLMGNHLSRLDRLGSAPPLLADSYDDRMALRLTIERKADKAHQTDGRPFVLVIYIDGVYHPAGMPAPWAQSIFASEGPQRHWSEIWLYDVVRNVIVAHWSKPKPPQQLCHSCPGVGMARPDGSAASLPMRFAQGASCFSALTRGTRSKQQHR